MPKNIIPDSETRATAEHAKDLRLWLRMLACTNLIENHVRARLRSDFDITLPRFDLMSQLERSPQGLKMGELSKRMMVTGGNVTGITDQLVREGLVVREDSPKDRRAYIVKLTAEGRKSFRRMAEAHEGWMVALFSGMEERQRDELYDLLASLKTSAAKVAAKH
ncbi:MAG: MarR family transcriptional regulator [Sulfuritalea sp.]|jgi:DNA-binding MarR family transcriptional regulator|nr:MarR family transcriptional regulator [Sulfuritalea sp.]MBK8761167.1 MarR family transcriptional regulator [Sulfuritalea sp.]MBK9349966.1 MarR family transcriptional regulator [Sulfuritalea sp.]